MRHDLRSPNRAGRDHGPRRSHSLDADTLHIPSEVSGEITDLPWSVKFKMSTGIQFGPLDDPEIVPRISELHIEERPGGPPVDASALRSIPIGEALKRAVQMASTRIVEVDGRRMLDWSLPPAERVKETTRRRYRRLTDDLLPRSRRPLRRGEAARPPRPRQIHRRAHARGSSTAARYLARARAAGGGGVMAHIQKQVVTTAAGKSATRWQARYRGPDGKERTRRFDRKVDAENWLDANGADIARGAWIDPAAGKVTLRTYAERWLAQREVRQTTQAKYRGLLDRHILPALGDSTMTGLSPSIVRSWYSKLSARHPVTAASAYRLLGAICRTAIEDNVIGRSPCHVKGAASEAITERPTITVAELNTAVEATPDKWQLAILLAAWCQLRRGEILGLQPSDIDQVPRHADGATSRRR